MGFRGCDDDFAKGLEHATRHPKEFGMFVREFIANSKKREENIKTNAEGFLEKYAIKYCPFHSGGLVEGVKENSIDLNVGGINYKFNSADCATWRLCETPISFEKGLIEEISKRDLKELKFYNSIGCTTCGDKNGKGYFVGFHAEEGILKNRRDFTNDIPIYLFDGSKSCGHSYIFMQSFETIEIPLKEKGRMFRGKIIL